MQERESLMNATLDDRVQLPVQIWYDSLRETDDGRFSTCEV